MSFEEKIETLLARLESLSGIATVHDLKKLEHKIMAAIDNLNGAVTALTTAVDAAVTDINTATPTDTAIQAAADTITAQTARLNAAVNPPAPAPAPTATT
jgi:hypothetical protein